MILKLNTHARTNTLKKNNHLESENLTSHYALCYKCFSI